MNLGKQLYTLLKNQKEVFVKGLGTFRRIHTSATFDVKENVYLPPLSYIEFDALSEEGFDFISYLQQADGVERSVAENRVEQAVSAIRAQVAHAGQVTLDQVGHLISYGNTFVFKPLDISGFNFKPIAELRTVQPAVEDVQVEESVPVAERVLVQEEITPKEQEVEVVHVPGEEFPEQANILIPHEGEPAAVEKAIVAEETTVQEGPDEPGRGGGAFIYGLLAALALLAMGGIYYYKTYYEKPIPTVAEKETEIVEQPVEQAPEIESPWDVADTTDTEEPLVADTSGLTSSVEAAKAEPVKSESVKKFVIVIGSHKSLKQANMEVEDYHKKGHTTVRLLGGEEHATWKRVIWDSYATAAERDAALRDVRKNVKADATPHALK